MRFTRKAAVLSAATALLAGGALAVGAGTAGAAAPRVEGTFPITDPGCHVSEEIQLQGSPKHDYMRWETTGNSTGCSVWMTDNSRQIEAQDDLTAGYHHSDWYYDGPGHTLMVCVVSPAFDIECGRQN